MFSQTGVYLFGGEAKISRTMNAFGAIHARFFGLYGKELFSVYPYADRYGAGTLGQKTGFPGGFPYT